jgi:Tol biopolymer transport system component
MRLHQRRDTPHPHSIITSGGSPVSSWLCLFLFSSVLGTLKVEIPSQELHPSWDPSGTRLVFESDRFGNADILVLDLSSDNVTRLTHSPAEDARPSWSPDGTWIVFHSNRHGNQDLFRVRPDGSELTRLTSSELDETNASWSPSSEKLVYEVRLEDRWTLRIMDLAAGTVHDLLNRPGDHLTPTWLGEHRIAFSYSPPGGNHDTDLVVHAVDDNGAKEDALLSGAAGNSNVDYSPIRNSLVFNSIRDGNWEIYTAGLAGEEELRLTTQDLPEIAGIDGQPAWDPSGTRIAIASARAGSFDIFVISPDGHEVENLTERWTITDEPSAF